MKMLVVIPLFLVLIILSFLGTLFVEANREEVVIAFFRHQSEPVALGFVVLTSILIGMIIAGALCSVEMLALYLKNRSLRRKVSQLLQIKKKLETEPTGSILPVRPEINRHA